MESNATQYQSVTEVRQITVTIGTPFSKLLKVSGLKISQFAKSLIDQGRVREFALSTVAKYKVLYEARAFEYDLKKFNSWLEFETMMKKEGYELGGLAELLTFSSTLSANQRHRMVAPGYRATVDRRDTYYAAIDRRELDLSWTTTDLYILGVRKVQAKS